MNLKEEILSNSGLYSLQNEDVYITEGIRFFKNSKRLRSLGQKMLKRLGKTKGIRLSVERKKGVVDLVKEIESVATDFEKVETEFAGASGDKAAKLKAKLKFKGLRAKHAKILKMMRKESVKTGLKVIGGIGLAVGVSLLMYHFFAANAVGTSVLGLRKNLPGGVDKLLPSATPPVSEWDWLLKTPMDKMNDAAAYTAAQANGVNTALAGAAGLTALGGVGILSKFFGRFKGAKAYKATEKTIQSLKDAEVTTAKDEKIKKKEAKMSDEDMEA